MQAELNGTNVVKEVIGREGFRRREWSTVPNAENNQDKACEGLVAFGSVEDTGDLREKCFPGDVEAENMY